MVSVGSSYTRNKKIDLIVKATDIIHDHRQNIIQIYIFLLFKVKQYFHTSDRIVFQYLSKAVEGTLETPSEIFFNYKTMHVKYYSLMFRQTLRKQQHKLECLNRCT